MSKRKPSEARVAKVTCRPSGTYVRSFRLHAHVAGLAPEWPAGNLDAVAEVHAAVRFDGAVPKIQVRHELRVGDDQELEARSELADVGERVLDLERVAEAHVESLPELPIDAGRPLRLDVPDDGAVGRRVGRDEQREDVELGPNEAARPCLEEARLPELRAEALFGERIGRFREVVDARRIEDDPRLHLDVEAAEPAEKVVVLPPGEDVGAPS